MCMVQSFVKYVSNTQYCNNQGLDIICVVIFVVLENVYIPLSYEMNSRLML